MTFTVKAIKKARAKRDNLKGSLLRQQQNIPALPAGPKNSNGPKGGSRQKSARFNRAKLYAAKGEKVI